MANPIIEIEAERLRLRRLDAVDASFVLRLVNEPSWLRFIDERGVHDLDGARRYIVEGQQRLYAQHGFGLCLVERRSDALPGEAEAVTGQGMTFVQIPVPWEKPEPTNLQQFFGVMDAFAGRRVWVHCARNFRVSAFVYLYRRLRLGEGHEAARHPMRTVWQPNPTWQAFIEHSLANPIQGAVAGTTR